MSLRKKIETFLAIGRRRTSPPPPQQTMTIRFPREVYERLKAASDREQISANRLAVLAMQAALAELATRELATGEAATAAIETTEGEPCPSA